MSAHRHRPYVGIAAVKSVGQAEQLIQASPFLHNHEQVLVLSAQTSNKTIYGLPNKYPLVFPSPHEIVDLGLYLAQIQSKPVEFHLHWFTDSLNLDQQLAELDQLIAIASMANKVEGLQINLTWPDPQLWHRWRQAFPASRCIQPVTKLALQELADQPHHIHDKLSPYRDCITEVFFDASGGLGLPIDIYQTSNYLHMVRSRFNVGVAGGLGPDQLLAPINQLTQGNANAWPLSWDAQSKLYHNDRQELDLDKAIRFLHQSKALGDW